MMLKLQSRIRDLEKERSHLIRENKDNMERRSRSESQFSGKEGITSSCATIIARLGLSSLYLLLVVVLPL